MSNNGHHHPTTTTSTTQQQPPTPNANPTKDEGGGGGQQVEGAEAVEDGGEGTLKGRRKLENADSSYDSDFDPNERGEDDMHGDVCRTVSDTLGAEFAEYVTKFSHHQQHNPHQSKCLPPVTSTTTSTTTFTSPPLPPPPPPTKLSPSTITKSSATTPTTPTTTTTTSTQLKTTQPTSDTTLTTTATTTTTTATTTVKTATPSTLTSTTTTSKDTPTTTTTTTTTTATTPSSSTTTTATTTTALPTLTLTQPQQAPKSDIQGGGRVAAVVTDTVTEGSGASQRQNYVSQVEFGIKLGYSEALVQLALNKLGATPDKDDLLAELIRLGTTAQRSEGGAADAGEDREDLSGITAELDIHSHHDQQQQQQQQQPSLRPVIIDGSNVAMSHGNKTTFSCRGLRVCVEWFRARGHTEITVFVPAWRKEAPRWDTPIAEQDVLLELERERVLVFTPSRVCGGKRIVSYDDRYILNEAVTSGGVVVSNDNYRDLAAESPGFRRVVEESLLMYSWVNGRFVPPDDPLGRSGPTLDVFLRRSARDKDKQAPCPYGRKCTYGNKCKYKHPERGTAPLKSVTERLQEQAQRHYQNKAKSRDSSPGEGLRGSLSLPVCVADTDVSKKPLVRTRSIVPTVSLTLPSSLTQETPTHDHSPTTPAPSHHHLMPPSLDPHRSATIYKSDSALYHHYAPNPYGSSTWGWEGGQGAPSQGQPGPYGSHLPLSKQQSDPDAQDNPHRKLQRQLTLNPSYDSRLYKIYGFREPAPEHFPLAGTTPSPGQGQQGSPSRMGRPSEGSVFPQGQGRGGSPGYSSAPYSGRDQVPGGLHPPLARGTSQDGAKHLTSLPPHLYPSYSHPHVTRYSSAPDPIWGGPHQQASAPPLITRLNSTSDTRLNLYGTESHYFPDVYDDSLGRQPTYPPVGHPPGPSPGPVGSRPMSPQGAVLHHSPNVSPRGHTPPQQPPGAGPPPASTFPPPGHEDTRLRVFYHLSQLFPEAQVRAVMALHPEETDPQKICGYILAAAGQGTSRPMSPQHQQTAPPPTQPPATPYLLQPFPAGPLTAPASHEDARLRAFYHLSQLFPEAEVRAVLARAPDETDTQQFCAALLALHSASQS